MMNIFFLVLVSSGLIFLSSCTTENSTNKDRSINTDSDVVISSSRIEKFQSFTAGPNTFIKIEGSDVDVSAFPVFTSTPAVNATKLSINPNILVVADEDDGLLRVLNTNSFIELGHLNGLFTVLNINFVSDESLYIDTVGQGLRHISISDPGSPYQLRRILTDNPAYETLARDDLIFQVSGSNGFEVWDITDFTNPVKVSQINFLVGNDVSTNAKYITSFQARAISIIDSNTVLVAARSGGVFVIDIENPAAPFIRDRYYPKDTQIWDIGISGSEAYLAAGSEIHVLDISNLDNITPVLGIEAPGFVQNVRVNDGYVTFTANKTDFPKSSWVISHRVLDGYNNNYVLVSLPSSSIANDAVYQSNAIYIAAGNQVIKLAE